jgi:hypothetical protein
MDASRAARASAICRSVAVVAVVEWEKDLGLEELEEEVVVSGEVVDRGGMAGWFRAGSVLVVDIVGAFRIGNGLL